MKERIGFGSTIEFNEVFSRIFYRKVPEPEGTWTKFYEGMDLGEESESKIGLGGNLIFYRSYRKVVFKRQVGSGIVIGQTKRVEGTYEPSGYSSMYFEPNDDGPPYLTPTYTFTFWVVAIGMNKTVLVPK